MDNDTLRPAPFQIWQHKNGNEYIVLFLTNEAATDVRYPIQVVYENTANGNKFSRALSDWHRSMRFVKYGGIEDVV